MTPSLERIRRVFRDQTAGAAEQALFALLLAVVVGGAHLARLGTFWARGLTAGAILAVLLLELALPVRMRKVWSSPRLSLRRVLFATDPGVGERALRALALVERTAADDTVGSAELAELHFTRIVDRVSSDAVRAAGVRYAQRFRGVAVTLLSAAALAVVMGPSRVVEGLDVLAARHGRAPVPMSWLRYPRVGALPPSYTRESERTLVFGTSVELPKGTVVTVRGVPRVPDRALVVTDGTHEEPFTSDGAGGVVARYVARSSTTLRVAARFGDVRVDDEDSLEIAVVPDAPPTVEVEGAPKTVKLAEVDRIDVRWLARDDHGLRETDLVLRSGPREDRRVLGRFDGESKVERGGHVLFARDAFLRRMFLPVTITVEAKDNDPLDGPKWSASAPITVVPPEVGQPEAERFAAMKGVRDLLVDLLAWRQEASPADARAGASARIGELRNHTEDVLAASYSGATIPRGVKSFVEGQLDRLSRAADGGDLTVRSLEDALLALDVTLQAIGNRDAAEVSKRLGDVAEEAALGARLARETEHKEDGMARLDVALSAVEKGAEHLVALAALGRDVGSVAKGDAGRVRRARTSGDLLHAELAALHLAARLRRPSPSFGSTTGGGGRGGVESGRGRGGSGLPSPSNADEAFDRAADQLESLAREHENALRGVESALDAARRSEASDAEQEEAKKLAGAVRDSVEPLPLPGEEFGSPRAAAALAREHASAAAHALENFDLSEAEESAQNALGALDQAEKRLSPDDPLRDHFAGARSTLQKALDWAKQKREARRAEAEARARSALEQAGDVERDLGEKAGKLAGDEKGGPAALPRDLAEQLERAGSVMREAARELSAGHGERGAELQREAQRLLEQSRPGRSDSDDKAEEDASEREQNRSSRRDTDSSDSDSGKGLATHGDVPGPDDRARAEEFRKRVLEGLGREKSDRLSPAVKRYAEGLLR